MEKLKPEDWGMASEVYDVIKKDLKGKNLLLVSEAQTRFDVIDRIIKELLGWEHGQITVEERTDVDGYVDYILRSSDKVIVIEVKKIGAAFPTPTKLKKLKLTGSVLGSGEIAKAIKQVEEYAKDKKADIVMITNGFCWCYYPVDEKKKRTEIYASLLFPFEDVTNAVKLFACFSSKNVEKGSLITISSDMPLLPERKLLLNVKDFDARVDRNNIADSIIPALDKSLYAESIINNKEQLERCFVTTHGRAKHDKILGIYLADTKPTTITPVKRIDTKNTSNTLKDIVKLSVPSYAPPVTLIIGQVGAGKTTYLKHFEHVSGESILIEKKAHWIYIDFEKLGIGGDPRNYIYEQLRSYLLKKHPNNPTNYKTVVEPAYKDEIEGLMAGPWALIRSNKVELKKVITDYINTDYTKVEPYVDKIFNYIAQKELCIIVLDNIDLYEDEELETKVFSEGIALSKKLHCNIIVSIRDKTFINHRTDSSFDAYELRKLWLDPPSFREVLSKRLSYSKKILERERAEIIMANGMRLVVPDLSVFFDIVQRSILSGLPGDFIDSLADNNIRKGLNLVTNFLTSGHIQGDNAIKNYLDGEHDYTFPFHEVFKGSVLGQWKNYKEDRSECINLFDSRLGSRSLRLLRLYYLKYLWLAARSDETKEVQMQTIISLFTKLGASSTQILKCSIDLIKTGLMRNIAAEELNENSQVVITKRGGFYIKYLCTLLPYVESVLHDTAIDDEDAWEILSSYTLSIESETSVPKIYAQWMRKNDRLDCLRDIAHSLLPSLFGIYPLNYSHPEEYSRSLASTIHQYIGSAWICLSR